jgi:hypothetical protein
MKGFIFAAAMTIAIASPVLAALTRSVEANWNIRFSYSLALIWVAIQVVAVVRHRWRGLWILIGLPIVLWWPIVFRMMEYPCRHNENACL